MGELLWLFETDAGLSMNPLTKYDWFREHILGVDAIFYPTKRLVGFLRNVGIVR